MPRIRAAIHKTIYMEETIFLHVLPSNIYVRVKLLILYSSATDMRRKNSFIPSFRRHIFPSAQKIVAWDSFGTAVLATVPKREQNNPSDFVFTSFFNVCDHKDEFKATSIHIPGQKALKPRSEHCLQAASSQSTWFWDC